MSPAPSRDEVHVWTLAPSAILRLARPGLLDAAERARADAFRFEADRACFVAAHTALRLLLAACVGAEADELRFRAEVNGKPELVLPAGARTARFSLSHARGAVAIAIAADRPVGVDVEPIPNVGNDVAALARSTLTERERAQVARLDAAAQRRYFCALWVRKEAVLKAAGVGLGVSPARVDVAADDAAGMARVDTPDGRAWLVRELALPDGFAGAVAAPGPSWSLRQFAFD